MSNDPFPSLAGIKATLKASAARGSSTTFRPMTPERLYPANILKPSDFIPPRICRCRFASKKLHRAYTGFAVDSTGFAVDSKPLDDAKQSLQGIGDRAAKISERVLRRCCGRDWGYA